MTLDMETNTTFLTIMVVVALVAFLGFIVNAVLSGRHSRRQEEQKPAELANVKNENFSVRVTKEKDGMNVHITNTYDNPGPDSEDEHVFPELEEDIEPPKVGLDKNFWNQVAAVLLGEDVDPEERMNIANTLANFGMIPREDVSTWGMPSPEGFDPSAEEGEQPSEEPYHEDFSQSERDDEPPLNRDEYIFNI